MSLVGSVVYGSWRDGSDVFKDKKGYYVVHLDTKEDKFYKRYLKGFKVQFVHRRKTRKAKKAGGKKTRKTSPA